MTGRPYTRSGSATAGAGAFPQSVTARYTGTRRADMHLLRPLLAALLFVAVLAWIAWPATIPEPARPVACAAAREYAALAGPTSLEAQSAVDRRCREGR